MAVTAYQNPQLAQLKVNYNPFAKGLKEEGSISWSLKVKSNSSKVLNTERGNAIAEQHPVKKSLKSLLANHKPRCPKTVNPKSHRPTSRPEKLYCTQGSVNCQGHSGKFTLSSDSEAVF
ncbi:MAX gene-associated protein [Oryzias melastigma]|uniref:MAX gene-associated protein n=1 Tax=Oryzias melastigma TaxID=30732 RepID=A0A834CCD1_ORYME|nr:MAX gene-associated protein [Oryzias melastigma]